MFVGTRLHLGSADLPTKREWEEIMASGLYVLQEGSVMVAYGPRHIAISCAQYKANGYKPALEKLVTRSSAANEPSVCAKITRFRDSWRVH
jgi:hypothetical protein